MSYRTVWPQDDEHTIFLHEECTLSDMLDAVKRKWPNAHLKDVQISARHIQTSTRNYDLYDSGDYDTFIVLTRE